MLSALRIDNVALVLAGRALPGRMSSQQGEDEGRAGHDAELAECHAEVSPRHRRVFSPDMPAVHISPPKKKTLNPGILLLLRGQRTAVGRFCRRGDVPRCVASG